MWKIHAHWDGQSLASSWGQSSAVWVQGRAVGVRIGMGSMDPSVEFSLS